ncbi:MAG: hypothetical protein ACHREM_26215, partial [Polyangiales bacterium]
APAYLPGQAAPPAAAPAFAPPAAAAPPPADFGAPVPGALPGSFGGPPAGSAPAPSAGAMAPAWTPPVSAMAAMATGPATPGQKRNPGQMVAIQWGALVGSQIVGQILFQIIGDTIGSLLMSLLALAGWVVFVMVSLRLIKELRGYLGGDEPPTWTCLLPIIKVPDSMKQAKQRAGCAKQDTVPVWMYLIIPAYAMQTDLNEIWEKNG